MKFFFAILLIAVSSYSVNAQISISEFFQDNVLNQLLADIQNNALAVIQSTFNQMLAQLLGKRDLDFGPIQNIFNSLFGQFQQQVMQIFSNLAGTLLSNIGNVQGN